MNKPKYTSVREYIGHLKCQFSMRRSAWKRKHTKPVINVYVDGSGSVTARPARLKEYLQFVGRLERLFTVHKFVFTHTLEAFTSIDDFDGGGTDYAPIIRHVECYRPGSIDHVLVISDGYCNAADFTSIKNPDKWLVLLDNEASLGAIRCNGFDTFKKWSDKRYLSYFRKNRYGTFG